MKPAPLLGCRGWPPTPPHLHIWWEGSNPIVYSDIYHCKRLLFCMHGAEEIIRFKQKLRQWNEVFSVRLDRQNCDWLLDNKRLYFVWITLQLTLWFFTYLWQTSTSYANVCSLAALFWAMCYQQWCLSELGVAGSTPPDGQLSRQKQKKAKTGQMLHFSVLHVRKSAYMANLSIFSELKSELILFIAFQLRWWSISCQEAQSASRRTKPRAD